MNIAWNIGLQSCRYLYLPLVDAERAWASAMQLKSEANTEPRKRFHMVSRLKKAVVHAETLFSLCESDKCDARTKLEAQVDHQSKHPFTSIGIYKILRLW